MIAAERAYLVLTVERTGSNLLCDALARTHRAGQPQEWFGYTDLHERALAAGAAAADSCLDSPKLISLPFYVGAIAARHSYGGVFGAKVHRYQFLQLERDRLADSPLDLLPHARRDDAQLVLLTRNDRPRQAISILMAQATGVYAVSAEREEAKLPDHVEPPRRDIRLDSPKDLVETLDGILASIVEHEQGWRDWCRGSGLDVLELSYEALCDDYPEAVDRVMRHVTGAGVDPRAVPKPRLGMQRGEETERLLSLWTGHSRAPVRRSRA